MATRHRCNGQGTLFKRVRDGPWIARYYDHGGRRRQRSTKTTDRRAAERILSKHVADTAIRRDGVIDPVLDAILEQSQRSVEAHLADFEAKMKAGSRDPKHIRSTLGWIRTVAKASDWHIVADINADDVARYAGTLKDRNRSARTIQAHLTAIKSLSKWLANHQKLPRDPLASVSKPDPKSDRRRKRRMLLPDEWTWLESTTLTAGERYGMTGPARVLLYATAIQTGYRANEVRSLTRSAVTIASTRPYLSCNAGSTKNRKAAKQHIQPELAEKLSQHVARKAPQAPIFSLPAPWDLAEMLRADLADARAAWLEAAQHDPDEHERREQSDFLAETNEAGQALDFHALRHTCGAWLAMAGVHPKVVQEVMRHSSITLTLDTYGHLFPGQEADAVSKLPMTGPGPEQLRATGTADAVADSGGSLKCAQRERISQRDGARRCESSEDGSRSQECLETHEKPPETRFPASSGAFARSLMTTPPGTRTPDPLIKSQRAESITPDRTSTYDTPSENVTPSAHNELQDAGSVPEPDPEWIAVVEAWPKVPKALRPGIVAMIQAATESRCCMAGSAAVYALP